MTAQPGLEDQFARAAELGDPQTTMLPFGMELM
jgi:hypothetical protein